MATSLKLVHEDLSDLTLIAAEGAGLRAQRWTPAQAEISYRDIPDYVVEEIDLRADRDTDDNLATLHQDLELRAAYAEWFWYDRTIYKPLWLYSKLDGETYERRALVKRISYEFRSNPISETGLAAVHDTELRIRIERHPYWESLNEYTVAGSDVSGASVVHDPSDVSGDGEIVGTVPARPWVGFYSGDNPANLIDRLWMGIRSEKHGDPTNFLGIWECESSFLGTDANLAADATASPGGGGNTCVEVDFATTPGWAERVTGRVASLTANPEDQPGRFMELLRAKVDSSTECEIRLKVGFYVSPAGSFIAIGPDVPVTNTSWDYYETGEAVIPPIDCEGDGFTAPGLSSNLPDHAAIQIWARRTSGSGSLYLDCLCPVPIDEGYAFLSEINLLHNSAFAHFFLTERDSRVAWSLSAGGIMEPSVLINAHNFRFPPGEVRLIVVWAQDTLSNITDSIILDSAHFSRWASLRGADGSIA